MPILALNHMNHDRPRSLETESERPRQVTPEHRHVPESAEPGTYGEVVIAFDRLSHAWRNNEEIEAVRNMIQHQQKLDEATNALQRLGSRANLHSAPEIARLHATYQEHARTAVDPESKKKYNDWARVLTNFLNSTNGLHEAKSALQKLGDLTNPLAHEGLLAYQRAQQASSLEKTRMAFEPPDTNSGQTQRFREAKQALDQQLNPNGQRINLDDSRAVQRIIDGWRQQLNKTTDDHERARYHRWIQKLVEFQQLRPEHQDDLNHHSTETRADNTSAVQLRQFMLETGNNQGYQNAVEQEAQRIRDLCISEPRLVQRYVLEEGLRVPNISPTTRAAAETVLRYYTAKEQAKTEEDRWFRSTFGKRYEDLKQREADLYRTYDALKKWYLQLSDGDSDITNRYEDFVNEHGWIRNPSEAFYQKIKAEVREGEKAIAASLEDMKRSRAVEYERAVGPHVRTSDIRREAVQRDTAAAHLDLSLNADFVLELNTTLRRSSTFHDSVRDFITRFPKETPVVR